MSTQQLNNIINGRSNPTFEMVDRLAEVLEVAPIDLLFPGELPKPITLKPTPADVVSFMKEIEAAHQDFKRQVQERFEKLQTAKMKK